MDDSFKNQFIKDLSYFNYNKKIRTSKGDIHEKTLKNIPTYDMDEIYDEGWYLKPKSHLLGGGLETKDGWLDMGNYPQFNDDYEIYFEEDESKYIIYLFLWVIKINLKNYHLFIRDDDDDKLVGIEDSVLKEIFNKVNDYFNKSRSENKKKIIKDKNINISELMENYDEIYDHLYPKIKRYPKPINEDEIEVNKQYANRKVHKSQNKRQLIKYFNGEDNITNERYIKLFAYALRN